MLSSWPPGREDSHSSWIRKRGRCQPAEARYYTTSPKATAGVEWVDWGGASKVRSNDWITIDALMVLRAANRLSF